MKNYEASSNMQIGSLVVGALGCFLLLLLWWKRKSSTSPASPNLPLPPGTFGFLWVGETFNYFNDLRVGGSGRFVRERTAKFRSKTFKTQICFQNTVVVQGVAANRFIAAAENSQQLLNSWPAWIIKVLGEHTPVAQHGAPHRRLRQIMTSCLGPVALRKLVGRVDLMTHLHFESCWKDQSQVFLLSIIQQHTFRIACRLLAGIEDEALMERIYRQFKIWLIGLVTIPVDLPCTAFRRAKNAKQMLVREMDKVIESKLQITAENNWHSGDEDLLGMMLRARAENGSGLNREELQDVILFLLFAGYDTSTSTLSFVIKYLEQNTDCYHRLRQEHEAIASQKSREERLNWEDVHNMKYTWAVIQETMRLKPINGGGFKEAQHDLDFEGYRIPQGWKMFYDITSTHDDEQFFPEPLKFDPSRFEKLQEGDCLPSYVFIPFGIGPHSCPGSEFARMTMSIYLHHLALRQFKWVSIDPNEKIHMFPTLQLAKGYPAKICIERQP